MNFVESLSIFHVDAKEIPCLTGNGTPTEKTQGAPGVLYMDTATGELFKCRTADEVNMMYTWEEIGGGNSAYKLPVGGNALGGVKNGGNVTINPDGTMTASGAGSGGNADQVVLKSPDGTAWKITVSNDGGITATKVSGGVTPDEPSEPETGGGLETYTIFVPQNVSDEWKVTGDYGTLNMSTTEFLELFYDSFVTTPPDGVTITKNSIGKDQSGLYDMWEYDFCPANYSRTILLSSGMHTYELSASFGLANFIGHLYTDTENDAFNYIRENVRIKVIPIVNPWGFNQYPKKYGNVNGVNPNRNFDLDGEWAKYPEYSGIPGDSNYNQWNVKGAHPFSESETVNLTKWALDNWNAEFWIDCHTGEGYADKDLWVYYSSNSAILNRINGGISAIEKWFKQTYGTACLTTRTIDSADSIRLRWVEQIAGIPGMTLEQAPGRTTFGTSYGNDSGDISNYSTNISTFVQELLLEKYRNTAEIAIVGVKKPAALVMDDATLSATVEAAVSPADTTQNKFIWTSSDESVCKVYGGTNKAVVVRTGYGEATLTGVNRYNSSIVATCNVTVNNLAYRVTNNLANVTTSNINETVMQGDAYSAILNIVGDYSDMYVSVLMGGVDVTADVYADGVINIPNVSGDIEITAVAYSGDNFVFASIMGIDSTTGEPVENNARILTALIPVDGGTSITVTSLDGYFIKAFEYGKNGASFLSTTAANYIGNLKTATITGTLAGRCSAIRVICKKSDGSAFAEDELTSAVLEINGTAYDLVSGDITADISAVFTDVIDSADCLCEIGTLSATNGGEEANAARIRTDFVAIDGASGAIGIAFTGLLDGCSWMARFYDSNKNFLEVQVEPAWEPGRNSTTKVLVCANDWYKTYKNTNYASFAYARFILLSPNGADINTADFANAAIVVDGHEHKLKFAE